MLIKGEAGAGPAAQPRRSATLRSSATKRAVSSSRVAGSGSRSSEDGWIVAMTCGARGEATIEKAAGRPDEGQPVAILDIAGLLADQHHSRIGRSGAEHRLGRVPVERTGGAGFRRLAQAVESRFRRDE